MIISGIFVIFGLVIIAGVILLLVLVKRGGNNNAVVSRQTDVYPASGPEYQSEQNRILEMIQNKSISAEDGHRLLEALDREVMLKKCPFCAEEIKATAVKCKHCGALLDGNKGAGKGKLVRSSTNVMICGVCGGIAEQLNLDPTLVRIGYVIITLLTGVLLGIIMYFMMVIIVPRAAKQ